MDATRRGGVAETAIRSSPVALLMLRFLYRRGDVAADAPVLIMVAGSGVLHLPIEQLMA